MLQFHISFPFIQPFRLKMLFILIVFISVFTIQGISSDLFIIITAFLVIFYLGFPYFIIPLKLLTLSNPPAPKSFKFLSFTTKIYPHTSPPSPLISSYDIPIHNFLLFPSPLLIFQLLALILNPVPFLASHVLIIKIISTSVYTFIPTRLNSFSALLLLL